MPRNANKYKEPCAICENWTKGVACGNVKCPVYKMKAENERLKAQIKKLESAKPADEHKVIHAHWIDAEGIPVCSHCGHSTEDSILEFDGTAYVSRLPYFCGNCSAKMDEEEV